MRSIADVIRDVIDNTDVEHIATTSNADELYRQITKALLAAGHPVTEPPHADLNGDHRVQMRGRVTLHLESSHEEGEAFAIADLTAKANVWLTPVVWEGRLMHDGPALHYEPDTFVRYDVVLEGFTVPRDGKREHLRIAEARPE